jgi:hypothetical protein
MAESLYELTFYGRLVDGVGLDVAKANVTALFKASPAQVEKMFMGGRVVIRNKLDQATGNKYIAVMRKKGLVCEIELMGGTAPSSRAPSPVRETSPAQPVSELTEKGKFQLCPPVSSQAQKIEDIGFNLAGEKVNIILQQSHLGLDPEGVRLSEHEDVDAPVFSELNSITIAPTGSVLVDEKDEVPPIVPDTSDISIAPTGSDMGQIKKDEKIEVPDLSHLKLDDLPKNQ